LKGVKKKTKIMAKESVEESSKPWSPLSSIMVLSKPQPSLSEQTFPLNINIPQESYGVINVSQETQFTDELQSLNPMPELIDLLQSNKQFTTDQLIYTNYLDYETQSTEIIPFNFDKNTCVDTILPFCFDENPRIGTTSTLHFSHNIPQDLNNYSISTVNPNSFLFDSTFTLNSSESTDEQLYNIFYFPNIQQ
ncbi:22149_t:CDS:1, partial [Gigaspora rosea]